MVAQVQAVAFNSAMSSLGDGSRWRWKLSLKLVPVHCWPVRPGGAVLAANQRASRCVMDFNMLECVRRSEDFDACGLARPAAPKCPRSHGALVHQGGAIGG